MQTRSRSKSDVCAQCEHGELDFMTAYEIQLGLLLDKDAHVLMPSSKGDGY